MSDLNKEARLNLANRARQFGGTMKDSGRAFKENPGQFSKDTGSKAWAGVKTKGKNTWDGVSMKEFRNLRQSGTATPEQLRQARNKGLKNAGIVGGIAVGPEAAIFGGGAAAKKFKGNNDDEDFAKSASIAGIAKGVGKAGKGFFNNVTSRNVKKGVPFAKTKRAATRAATGAGVTAGAAGYGANKAYQNSLQPKDGVQGMSQQASEHFMNELDKIANTKEEIQARADEIAAERGGRRDRKWTTEAGLGLISNQPALTAVSGGLGGAGLVGHQLKSRNAGGINPEDSHAKANAKSGAWFNGLTAGAVGGYKGAQAGFQGAGLKGGIGGGLAGAGLGGTVGAGIGAGVGAISGSLHDVWDRKEDRQEAEEEMNQQANERFMNELEKIANTEEEIQARANQIAAERGGRRERGLGTEMVAGAGMGGHYLKSGNRLGINEEDSHAIANAKSGGILGGVGHGILGGGVAGAGAHFMKRNSDQIAKGIADPQAANRFRSAMQSAPSARKLGLIAGGAGALGAGALGAASGFSSGAGMGTLHDMWDQRQDKKEAKQEISENEEEQMASDYSNYIEKLANSEEYAQLAQEAEAMAQQYAQAAEEAAAQEQGAGAEQGAVEGQEETPDYGQLAEEAAELATEYAALAEQQEAEMAQAQQAQAQQAQMQQAPQAMDQGAGSVSDAPAGMDQSASQDFMNELEKIAALPAIAKSKLPQVIGQAGKKGMSNKQKALLGAAGTGAVAGGAGVGAYAHNKSKKNKQEEEQVASEDFMTELDKIAALPAVAKSKLPQVIGQAGKKGMSGKKKALIGAGAAGAAGATGAGAYAHNKSKKNQQEEEQVASEDFMTELDKIAALPKVISHTGELVTQAGKKGMSGKKKALIGAGAAGAAGATGAGAYAHNKSKKNQQAEEMEEQTASEEYEESMNGLFKEAAEAIMNTEIPETQKHTDPMDRIKF